MSEIQTLDVIGSVLTVAALIGVFVFVRRRSNTENVRPDELRKNSTVEKSRFHAVSIKFSQSACEAARNMEGRRFLSGAAPRIPLPGCDAVECRCKFIHHKDRRSGDDRRNPFRPGLGGAGTGKHPEEQRKRGERRAEPPEDAFH